MKIEDKIKIIYNSDNEFLKYFLLKPYELNRKEYLFIQLKEVEQDVDLERVIIQLDSILAEIARNGLYNIVFSFKGITFFDLSYSIIISHTQLMNMKGGEIIYCDVYHKIIEAWHYLEFDKIAKIYSSEAEMLEKNNFA